MEALKEQALNSYLLEMFQKVNRGAILLGDEVWDGSGDYLEFMEVFINSYWWAFTMVN